MTTIAVLGAPVLAAGYAAAGVRLLEATTADEVRRCWHELPDDVGVVLLTPAAAAAVGRETLESSTVLTVVLPP